MALDPQIRAFGGQIGKVDMRNASNAVARSIGRGIALVAIVVLFVLGALLFGLIPVSFAP